jgi:hypothetical protein
MSAQKTSPLIECIIREEVDSFVTTSDDQYLRLMIGYLERVMRSIFVAYSLKVGHFANFLLAP